jgi:hypothetical protein
MNTFDEVMTGPLDKHADYNILKDYDLVYLRIRGNDEPNYIKNLRVTCPDSILIGYTDEWVNFRNFPLNTWIYHASLYLDAITCGFGEPHERKAFQMMGIKNYYHLPYAGPIKKWAKWYKPLEEKEFAIAGMWHMRSIKEQGRGDRVHSMTLKIFKEIQNRTGCNCYFFLNFDGHKTLNAIRSYAINLGLKCKFLKHMSNSDFNEKMASVRVFFEEYQCPAYSRATVVSAAVGTPQVGNDMNEPSQGCFPDLTSKFGDWSKNRDDIYRLMTDDKFWIQQSVEGQNNCEYYYYPAYQKRLLDLYNHLKQ